MNVKLELSLEEAVAVVNMLGSLPTRQGAWALFLKLKNQVEPFTQQPAKVALPQEPLP